MAKRFAIHLLVHGGCAAAAHVTAAMNMGLGITDDDDIGKTLVCWHDGMLAGSVEPGRARTRKTLAPGGLRWMGLQENEDQRTCDLANRYVVCVSNRTRLSQRTRVGVTRCNARRHQLFETLRIRAGFGEVERRFPVRVDMGGGGEASSTL
ncbi:hypothetical protein V8C37DRAFT_389669 [Trichoderma ceciliae]